MRFDDVRELLRSLGRLDWNFRNFYLASFLVDLGLCLYFFLFTLFLVAHHVSEREIGYITASLTVGTLAGTIPVSMLVRRVGLQKMLLLYVVAAPLCLALRTFLFAVPIQICFGFMAGVTISIWSVCFSPTLAKLTTPENRAFSFGLFVATGIGAGALSGVVGGYLPRLAGSLNSRLDGLRIGLWCACFFISLASIGVIRLRTPRETATTNDPGRASSFLIRFLLAAAVWSFAMGFFTPFATVYLSRRLGLSFAHIAEAYTVAQIFQVAAVLLAPLLYRRVGLIRGIALTQIATGLALFCMSRITGRTAAVSVYVLLTTLQYMGGPGIAALLMNNIPERNRSHAAGLQNLVNLAAQAFATAIAGRLFERFNYARPLALNAGISILAATLFYCLLRSAGPGESYQLRQSAR
jgi:MFS family permease